MTSSLLVRFINIFTFPYNFEQMQTVYLVCYSKCLCYNQSRDVVSFNEDIYVLKEFAIKKSV